MMNATRIVLATAVLASSGVAVGDGEGPPVSLSATLIVVAHQEVERRAASAGAADEPTVAGIPISDERWLDEGFILVTDRDPALAFGDASYSLIGNEAGRIEGVLRSLAEPNLVTLDGERGAFSSGDPNATPEPYGVEMAFTPRVLLGDAVLLEGVRIWWRSRVRGGGAEGVEVEVDGLALSPGQVAVMATERVRGDPAFLVLLAEVVRPLGPDDVPAPLPGNR